MRKPPDSRASRGLAEERSSLSAALKQHGAGVVRIALFLSLFFASIAVFAVVAGNGLLGELLGISKVSSGDYIVAGRKQALFSDASKAAISEETMASLASDPSIRAVYPVRSNAFDAEVELSLGAVRYRSEMFFEAVSDAALSGLPEGWRRRDVIPILVSRDFLALYNLAFAPSRGLPVLNESVFSTLPLDVSLRGKSGARKLRAVIVGTTGAFSSFLIPESVMTDLNRELTGSDGATRRVVITAYDAMSPRLSETLDRRGLEPISSGIFLSEAMGVVRAVSLVLATFGVAMAFLGMSVSVLGARLYAERKRPDLELLALLGYRPTVISARSSLTVLFPAIAAFAAAAAVSMFAYDRVAATLASAGLGIVSDYRFAALLLAFLPVPFAFISTYLESFRLRRLWINQ